MKWAVADVVGVHEETPTARTLMLRIPGWTGALAGQHIDIRLTAPDGYQAARSYSLSSACGSELAAVSVELMPDGEVSPYLVRGVSVGDQLEVLGPLGGWFVWRPTQPEPIRLIGGGSGIAPLVSILRTHAEAKSTAPAHLLYSVRSPITSTSTTSSTPWPKPPTPRSRSNTPAMPLRAGRAPLADWMAPAWPRGRRTRLRPTVA